MFNRLYILNLLNFEVLLSLLVCCGFAARVLYSCFFNLVVQGKDPRHTQMTTILSVETNSIADAKHDKCNVNPNARQTANNDLTDLSTQFHLIELWTSQHNN